MVYYIQISDQKLFEYCRELGWQGEGSQESPIVIDSLEGINEYIRFKKTNSYITIKNIELCEFYIESCENISIENCKIYYLYIENSSNLKVEGSSIVHINSRTSSRNIFRKNKLHEKSVNFPNE